MRLRPLVTATPALRPRWDALLILLASAGWYGGFHLRASFIVPVCAQNPGSCDPGLLNPLDRWGLVRHYDPLSDHLSYWTQDGSAVLAIAAFFALAPTRRVARTQLVLLIQCMCINGALLEGIRLLIQRPRPFVYLDPLAQGGAPAHYTSFYSGHTSFAALAATCAALAAMDARPAVRRTVFVLAAALTAATGALRVAAGRHFITDVAVGALAGAAIALAVNCLHRTKDHADPDTVPAIR